MKRIVTGIWTWSVHSAEKRLDFNGHLVANDEGCVLIDPPEIGGEGRKMADSLGPPEAILITNRHHTRDAKDAVERWRCPVYIHEEDAEGIAIGTRPVRTYRDGDLLPGGLRVVTLEAHKTPGESALLCPASDACIVGDAVIGDPAGSLRMLPDDKFADPARARRALRRLLDHPFDALLLGDGVSIPQGGRRVLEGFLART